MIEHPRNTQQPAARVAGSPAGRDRRVCPRYPFTATAENPGCQLTLQHECPHFGHQYRRLLRRHLLPLSRKTDVKVRILRDDHAEEPAAETAVAPGEPCPENHDPSLVVGELIMALMRQVDLSPEEGYFLLCKLTTKTCPTG